MASSRLQRYLLLTAYAAPTRLIKRKGLEKFYDTEKAKPAPRDQQNAITKSLERLIDGELMIGHGVRTPHKWYIREVRLTPKGARAAKKLLGEQQRLPFKLKK